MESRDPKIVQEEQVATTGLKFLPSDKLIIHYCFYIFDGDTSGFISFWIKGRNHLVLFKSIEISKVLKHGVLHHIKTPFLILICRIYNLRIIPNIADVFKYFML